MTYKIFYERFVKEIASTNNYNLQSIEQWSAKILRLLCKQADDSVKKHGYEGGDYSTVEPTYKIIIPTVLQGITDLYELEYKKHLISHSYSQYKDNIPIELIDKEIGKITKYLREFICTSICMRWISGIEPTPDNMVNIRNVAYNRFIYPNISYTPAKSGYWKEDSSNDIKFKGSYIYDKKITSPIFKRLFSNDSNERLVGVTMAFNLFHDDGRGLIAGQSPHEDIEEYSEILIPFKAYEKASAINHRKVEKELKQEIFGY